ncbi:GNAT family acetyltransferase [Rugosimonospora africana]|uniref:GNAT family acetyltransferase n=1 Tax=Rugosimonospora africana TaxID=556532 RepID=A0A8J3VVB7_9ACTN|nr:GNAT family acetyltransferase [Rugosimonospora africana]
MSQDAAARVERVDSDYLRVRVGALARVPGNPFGATVRPVGQGWAFLVEALPNPLFNHVMGLTAACVDSLPELAAWYAGHGKPLRVDVVPAQAAPGLFAALAAEGLTQTGFYAGLYAEASRVVTGGPADPSVHIGLLDPAEFAGVYATGFGFPDRHRAAMAESVRVLAGRSDVRFYGARIGTVVAGVGLLFLADGVGYLATAATLPEYRGRGVQGALVRHRAAAAREAGCDLIVGHTATGSASQRTMERNGLRLAYTKALWSGAG